jgi:integrase
MGHSSKKMIYDVYGDYVEGLEDDYSRILEYFGKDFISSKKRNPLALSPSMVKVTVKAKGPMCEHA